MRFASLKARYRKEYAELKAEAQGQEGELVQGRIGLIPRGVGICAHRFRPGAWPLKEAVFHRHHRHTARIYYVSS